MEGTRLESDDAAEAANATVAQASERGASGSRGRGRSNVSSGRGRGRAASASSSQGPVVVAKRTRQSSQAAPNLRQATIQRNVLPNREDVTILAGAAPSTGRSTAISTGLAGRKPDWIHDHWTPVGTDKYKGDLQHAVLGQRADGVFALRGRAKV
jgi:hypothetical protein